MIEVIVIISIVSVLTALLTLGIQYARESARRLHCANNLRQIGIALDSYIGSAGVLPQVAGGYSVQVMLLPQLEHSLLFNSINMENKYKFALSVENSTASGTLLEVFACPSDSQFGLTGSINYAGNMGNGLQKYGANGSFSPGGKPPANLADFTDGTVNTAAFSEWLLGPPRAKMTNSRRSVYRTPIQRSDAESFDLFVSDCQNLDIWSAQTHRGKGRDWLSGNLLYTFYNHVLNINEHSCLDHNNVQTGAYTAGSLHGSGANVLFADGHVVFVSDRIVLMNWRAIGSRNGGELLRTDSF